MIDNILFVAAGLFAGYAVYLSADRYTRGLSLFGPLLLVCADCGGHLSKYSLVPLIGPLLARYRCSHCGARIGWPLSMVTFVSGLLSLAVVWHWAPAAERVFFLFLAWGLLLIGLLDYRHGLIPNRVLFPLFFLLVGWNLLFEVIPWEKAIPGAVVAAFLLFLVRLAGNWWLGRESMGMGDVKLAGLLGFCLGWTHFVLGLFFAAVLALAFAIVARVLVGGPLPAALPFGPFLAAGAGVALFFGDTLSVFYTTLWL